MPLRTQMLIVVAVAGLAGSTGLAGAGFAGMGVAQQGADAAFDRYWAARSTVEARAAANAIVASGVSVDSALARLKAGRRYSSDVPRGVVRASHKSAAGEFAYQLDVPRSYSPDRRYRVRVQLHGGVSRPSSEPRGNGIGALAGDEQIYVLPTAWSDAPWWHPAQVASLRVILDAVKRTYNVDENAVAVSGVSDGGTGAFYLAMRDTTPYASFLPLNGFIMILANPSLALTETLSPNNLLNKPFFIVNGGRDPLYPTEMVEPYVRHLQRGGLRVTYHPQPDAGHNTAWWPEVKETFEAFVRTQPRTPHPSRLTWETDDTAAAGRAHWLVINELRPVGAGAPLADLNDRVTGAAPNFGVRTTGMRIASVVPGSNAQAMGLLPGDLIAAVNGRALPDGLDLLDFLGLFDAGAPLTFEVVRPDKTARMTLSGVYQPTMQNRVAPLFPRQRPTGRVDVEQSGNTVRATTRGVASFTLLLSPDTFDFTRPVVVEVDGHTAFSGRVEPSLATLMNWAARDNDRTMLYAAELPIRVP